MGRYKPPSGYHPCLDGGAFDFFGPSGLPISAAHLRQTRQAVNLGPWARLDRALFKVYTGMYILNLFCYHSIGYEVFSAHGKGTEEILP